MAQELTRKRLDVFEVRFDDGGVGILLDGGAGVYMGYDEADVMRLLFEVFEGADGDLQEAAERYLEGGGLYLTTEQVCSLYSVTPRTVYRWKAAGKIHGTKAGRRLLFARDEIEALAGTGEGMEA